MLVGRDQEIASFEELLDCASRSEPGVIVLRGEPGVGKTVLMSEVARRAAEKGDGQASTILRAQGHEVETQVAFGGLMMLLSPILGLLPELLEVQRSALAGALRLMDTSGGDRLTIGAATLNLISAAAERSPLLVLVDDSHWLDLPSLEAIAFASRRMRAERVAVVLAARTVADTDASVNQCLGSLPTVELSGLSESAAVELLANHDVHLDPARLKRHMTETAGNPLALIELAAHGNQHSPFEPLPIGTRLEQAFGRRLAPCSQSTRLALLLLAVSGTEAEVLERLLSMHGRSLADLEAAEGAGLVKIERGTVRFTHPLIRSAVYQLATPVERREAHRTMAAALVAVGGSRTSDRQAWHLAAATALPDAQIAAKVAAAAADSVQRRSYATGMELYEIAARLSPAGAERARRLLTAAEVSQAAGRGDAGLAILRHMGAETDDPQLLSQAVHLRCRIEMWAGRPVDARNLLIGEAKRLPVDQPVWKAIMFSHAALLTVTLGEQRDALAMATSAVDLVSSLPDDLIMPVLVVQALTSAIEGNRAAASALLERCESCLLAYDPLATDQLLLVAALAEDSLERPDAAMRWYQRATGSAREVGAAGLLPFQLNWLALAEWRRGAWAVGLSTAAEAVDLAHETGWRTEVPNSLASLALIEAGLGRDQDCASHTRQAMETAAATGAGIVEVRAHLALALLDLGNERPKQAARRLERVADFAIARGLGDPVLLSWAADAVEAGVRGGRPGLATTAQEVLVAEAKRSGRPTALARAARGHALLAAGANTAQDAIKEALDQHAQASWPFEEARTRLVQGELLRRDRQPSRAREALEQASDLFQRLGAIAFARRAANELRAAGGVRRPPTAETVQQLTPQEIHVTLVVAEGATNLEAATRLFLSPKTVEYHLSSVYRKLGIRSRGELVRAVANGVVLTDPSVIAS